MAKCEERSLEGDRCLYNRAFKKMTTIQRVWLAIKIYCVCQMLSKSILKNLFIINLSKFSYQYRTIGNNIKSSICNNYSPKFDFSSNNPRINELGEILDQIGKIEKQDFEEPLVSEKIFYN